MRSSVAFMKALTALLVFLSGCTASPPPEPPAPAPRSSTEVHTSAGRLWDAVIDHFASHTVPIRTIDRSSGLIVTEPMRVEESDGRRWGWCGWRNWDNLLGDGSQDADWIPIAPTAGSYNVLVRGDSTRATIRVTVRWVREYMGARGVPSTTECRSRDVFERELELAIAEDVVSVP